MSSPPVGHSLAYLADTNVYVQAANDPAFNLEFQAFLRAHGPIPVSAVVAAEVLFGVTDRERHRAVIRALVAGTELLAPDPLDWTAAASAIAALGGDAVTKVRSFWNDALLAAQCARLGLTVVTRNGADFRRLERHLAVRIVAPFPPLSPPPAARTTAE